MNFYYLKGSLWHDFHVKWFYQNGGWSSGAMVVGNLPVPGGLTYLDNSMARNFCTCRRCGRGLFGRFLSHLSFLSSFSLSLGDSPIQTKILSQRVVNPKTTNQNNLSNVICGAPMSLLVMA